MPGHSHRPEYRSTQTTHQHWQPRLGRRPHPATHSLPPVLHRSTASAPHRIRPRHPRAATAPTPPRRTKTIQHLRDRPHTPPNGLKLPPAQRASPATRHLAPTHQPLPGTSRNRLARPHNRGRTHPRRMRPHPHTDQLPRRRIGTPRRPHQSRGQSRPRTTTGLQHRLAPPAAQVVLRIGFRGRSSQAPDHSIRSVMSSSPSTGSSPGLACRMTTSSVVFKTAAWLSAAMASTRRSTGRRCDRRPTSSTRNTSPRLSITTSAITACDGATRVSSPTHSNPDAPTAGCPIT